MKSNGTRTTAIKPLVLGVALSLCSASHAQLLLDTGGQWGRIGAGLDTEGRVHGEMLLRLTPTANQRAIIEAFAGEEQALGLKLSYHVAPQSGPISGVLKGFVAFDRNATRDRKLTFGVGGEVRDMFWGLYTSRGLSDGRLSGVLGGTVIETRPYDWGLGLRVGTFFDSTLMRVTLGADLEKGKEGARQVSGSFLAEKYFSGSPVSVGMNVDLLRRKSDFAASTESTRAGMTIRVDVGGPRNLVNAGPSIARSLDNPLTHKSSVDVYNRRSTNPAVIGNLAPVPVDDAATAQSGGVEAIVDVLANDRDPNGDTLTLTGVGAAQNGVTRIVGGKIGYTATRGYVGNDAFTYTVADGKGGNATGTVRVAVSAATGVAPTPAPTPSPTPTPSPAPTPAANRAPVATADTFTVVAGSSANSLNVRANDSDPDGDALSITAITAPPNGTATISAGVVLYTPRAGYTGTDTFSYTVADGKGGSASANVAITVSPTPAPSPTPTPSPSPAPGANLPPVAVADTITVNCAGSTSFNVLANDSDPNAGDQLIVIGFNFPPASAGTLQYSGSGNFTFTGNGTNFGSTTFQYTVADDKNASASATVTLRCQ